MSRHSFRAALLALCASCAESSVRYPGAQPIGTQAFPFGWGTSPQARQTVATANVGTPTSSSPLIAVLAFTDRLQGLDKNSLDRNYVSNAVRAAVKRTRPASRLMTQENIQVLLASAHKTLEDCQGECEVDTGRLLGADIIVTGDLLRVGSKLKLDMRMHETKTGQLISGSDASGKSVDELDSDLPRAVNELMTGLR
jgi:TolB-like protein